MRCSALKKFALYPIFSKSKILKLDGITVELSEAENSVTSAVSSTGASEKMFLR